MAPGEAKLTLRTSRNVGSLPSNRVTGAVLLTHSARCARGPERRRLPPPQRSENSGACLVRRVRPGRGARKAGRSGAPCPHAATTPSSPPRGRQVSPSRGHRQGGRGAPVGPEDGNCRRRNGTHWCQGRSLCVHTRPKGRAGRRCGRLPRRPGRVWGGRERTGWGTEGRTPTGLSSQGRRPENGSRS